MTNIYFTFTETPHLIVFKSFRLLAILYVSSHWELGRCFNENTLLLSTNPYATKGHCSNCCGFALLFWAKFVASPYNCAVTVFFSQVYSYSYVKTKNSYPTVTVFQAGDILRTNLTNVYTQDRRNTWRQCLLVIFIFPESVMFVFT
jgi:hypothetical protein